MGWIVINHVQWEVITKNLHRLINRMPDHITMNIFTHRVSLKHKNVTNLNLMVKIC